MIPTVVLLNIGSIRYQLNVDKNISQLLRLALRRPLCLRVARAVSSYLSVPSLACCETPSARPPPWV